MSDAQIGFYEADKQGDPVPGGRTWVVPAGTPAGVIVTLIESAPATADTDEVTVMRCPLCGDGAVFRIFRMTPGLSMLRCTGCGFGETSVSV